MHVFICPACITGNRLLIIVAEAAALAISCDIVIHVLIPADAYNLMLCRLSRSLQHASGQQRCHADKDADIFI